MNNYIYLTSIYINNNYTDLNFLTLYVFENNNNTTYIRSDFYTNNGINIVNNLIILKELLIDDCYYLLHYNQPVDLSFIYNAYLSLLSLDDFYITNYKDLELLSNILDVINFTPQILPLKINMPDFYNTQKIN